MDLSYKEFKDFNKHKLITRFEDKQSKLRGFVAIHNNHLGPAVGGTRFYPYKSEKDAIKDVLRLSHSMSYKCALAGVKYGGGKAVIIGDPEKIKSDELLIEYAKVVKKLKGRFSTGEDVGMLEKDVQLMLEYSPFFIGKKGLAGDPSPYASLSTFYSIKTASRHVFGTPSLKNKKIAVKGVGKVGSELVRLLVKEEAEVYIADINRKAIFKIKKSFPNVITISTKSINKLKVDIYAPCAMGNEFTNLNKKLIKAKIICGAANNQLSTPEIGDFFHNNEILYIPDYVVNSGGLINVVDELEPGGYNKKRVSKRIRNVKITVKKIIEYSEKRNKPTVRIADEMAERKLKRKIKKK